jgi:hypothetical protein
VFIIFVKLKILSSFFPAEIIEIYNLNYIIDQSMSDNLMSFVPTTDTVIINKLFSIVEEFVCEKSFKSTCLKVVISSCKLATVYAMYFLYKHGMETMASSFKLFLFRLLYKRKTVQKAIKIETPIIYDGLVPAYLEKEDSNQIVYYIPYVHDNLIKRLDPETMISDQKTLFLENDKKVSVPITMFPSDNCILLDQVLDGYFEVFKHTRMVSSPLILINGIPGLGKSDSRYYLASLNKYDEIIYYNLLEMTNKSFSAIINGFLSKESDRKTVVFFDELDKYIELYTRYMYKLEKRGKNPSSGDHMDEIVDSDIHVFRRDVKENIIRTISNLNASIHNYINGISFVFCANNFQTVFDGLKQKHVNSVKTRFTFIDFKPCHKSELMRYIRVFNSKLEGTRYHYDDRNLSLILRRIKDDISITYRDISICQNKASYDIEKLVYYMNEGVSNPLLEYTYSSEEQGGESSSSNDVQEIEDQGELKVVDHRMETIDKIRTEKKNKEQIMKEISVMIDGDENTDEADLLSDDEVLTKMIEMSKGYHLLELMESPVKIDNDDYYILESIIRRNLIKTLTYLIDYSGIDIHFSNKYLMRTSMFYNKLEIIMLLLQKGAKLGPDQHPYALLKNIKTQSTMIQIITFLIQERNFDINESLAYCEYGGEKETIFYIIINRNMKIDGTIITFLTDNGYNFTQKDRTYIISVLERNFPTLSFLKGLVDIGVKFDVYFSNGESFFYAFLKNHHYQYEKHKDVFDFLVSLGANKLPFYNNKDFNIDNHQPHMKNVLKQFI